MNHSMDLGAVNQYHPPTHVAKHLIAHAIRNLPNRKVLAEKMYSKGINRLGPLKPHVYNDTGMMQFDY